MRKVEVHYESVPGMWELYSGTKTVVVDEDEEDEKDAEDKAFELLRVGFPNRPKSGWNFEVKW